MFYLSEFLEANRDEYYARLGNISKYGDWNGWIAFFLRAIAQQASQNSDRVKDIMSLYDSMKIQIQEVVHSQYTVYLLDAIFNKPIFTTSECAQVLNDQFNIHKQTTLGLLRNLKDAGILLEVAPGSGRRAATLCFPGLINLAEGKRVV